jgi:hypothetical protein
MFKRDKILRALQAGQTTQEIAKRYGIKVHSVHTAKSDFKHRPDLHAKFPKLFEHVFGKQILVKEENFPWPTNEDTQAKAEPVNETQSGAYIDFDPRKLDGVVDLMLGKVRDELLGDSLAEVDPVNHPEHYKVGGIETVDFIEAKGLNYNLGQVIKYISRAYYKGNLMEDLKKAQWYLNREISTLDGKHGKV